MSKHKNFLMEASFSDDEKNAVWGKGKIAVDSKTKDKRPSRRFDTVGALMCEEEYGDRDSEFGWEIDHIDNNTDNNELSNLRPLFYKNNLARNAKKDYTFYKYDAKARKNSTEVPRDKDI